MGYGSHTTGAWYLIVLSAAFFLLRYVILPRRRGRGRRAPGGGQPTSASAPPNATTGAPASQIPGHSGIPAGWMVDPSGRYDRRYWSGTEWTEHVTKDGVPGTDPPPVTSSAGG